MKPDVNNLILRVRDKVETIFLGLFTFEFVLDGYATQSIQVDVPEGSAVVQNAKLKKV